MIRMESTDGYEQKLLVTIQKYSDSKMQVVYWGNSSQINVNDICIYNPYEEDDLAAFEEKNVQWVEDENCEGSYIPVITGNLDGMEIKTCDYFEPGCDVSKWQNPVLTAQIDVMVSDILNLVVSNVLCAVDINIFAGPEGHFLADLIQNRFQAIPDQTLVRNTEIKICIFTDYESYNGEADVQKRILEKQYLSFWQPQLTEEWKNIENRQKLQKNYLTLSDNCLKADLKLLQIRDEDSDFETYFEKLTWKKAAEAIQRKEQKIATNEENAKGQWLKDISALMREDIGAEAKKLSELRHFKHQIGEKKDLWKKKRREYLQKNRAYLIYWCFLMKCSDSEVEELLTVAGIFPFPTNPGEQLLYSFMKRKDYDKKHLQEAINKAFPEQRFDIGQLLGIDI